MIVRIVARTVFSSIDTIADLNCTNKSRLVKEASNAQRILILCTGNICRSPFVEQYMRNSFEMDIEVESAGLETDDGRTCPLQAQNISEMYGIDVSDHRSKVVTEEQVEQADIVLLMDWYNYYRIRQKFEGYEQKRFLLGAINASNNPQISNPHGRGENGFSKRFQKCKQEANEIENVVDANG
jgi:protein-tyrosine phosphatase